MITKTRKTQLRKFIAELEEMVGNYNGDVKVKCRELLYLLCHERARYEEFDDRKVSSAKNQLFKGIVLALNQLGLRGFHSLGIGREPRQGKRIYPQGSHTTLWMGDNGATQYKNRADPYEHSELLCDILNRYQEQIWEELDDGEKCYLLLNCYNQTIGYHGIIAQDLMIRLIKKYNIARQLCNQLTQNLC